MGVKENQIGMITLESYSDESEYAISGISRVLVPIALINIISIARQMDFTHIKILGRPENARIIEKKTRYCYELL